MSMDFSGRQSTLFLPLYFDLASYTSKRQGLDNTFSLTWNEILVPLCAILGFQGGFLCPLQPMKHSVLVTDK